MKHGMLVVSALALLAGCEKANKGGLTKADEDLAPGEVKLLGAGVDPKVQLRYAVEKGTHTTVDMKVKMKMSVMGQSPPIPVMKMTMDETCTDVEPDGNMRFEIKVASIDIEATDAQAQQVASRMRDGMGNMVYRFRVTPSGKVDDVQVEGLTGEMAQLGQQMKGAMEQFAAPLPEEPVGKGSKWKYKKSGESNGVTMATVAEFELVDYKDQVATFKVGGRVGAPPQEINQGGVSAKLKKVAGTMSGTIANDLKRMAPTGNFDMDIDMSFEAMGQSATMSMSMDTTMTAR